MSDALVFIAALAALVAYGSYLLSRASTETAILCRCISQMLQAPERAEFIAECAMNDLRERGMWKS